MNALWAVQTAIVAALTGDDALMTLVQEPGVYDHVPAGAALPYIVIDDVTETPDDSHSDRGTSATLTLHAWSAYRGSFEVVRIMGRVNALLHRTRLDLGAEHRMVSMQREFFTILREGGEDPEQELRHAVMRLRIITEEV